MPYKSKAQQRKFFAMEAKGELPAGTAIEWAHETPDIKALPERVGKGKKTKKGKDAMQKVSRETLAPYINGYFSTLLDRTNSLNQPLHVKRAKAEHLVKFSQAMDRQPNLYEAIKVAFPHLDLAGQHKFARAFAAGLRRHIKRAMLGTAPTGPVSPPVGITPAPQFTRTQPASQAFPSPAATQSSAPTVTPPAPSTL